MAQEVISQKIRRTCDACGVVEEFEMQHITPETLARWEKWWAVIREVFDPTEGKMVKMLVQAHTIECVPAAAVKISLPVIAALNPNTDDSQPDNIDLASLQASAKEQVN